MKKTVLVGAMLVLVGLAVMGRRWWMISTAEVAALGAVPEAPRAPLDSTVVVLMGTVEAGGQQPLFAATAGRVRSIFFDGGDYVHRGQVLLKLANHTFVVAPHDGFMGPRKLGVGDYLPRKMEAGNISKRKYLLVPLLLPPNRRGRIQPGDSVRVWVAARPARVVAGVVAATSSPADSVVEIRLTSRAPFRIGEEATVQLRKQEVVATAAQ